MKNDKVVNTSIKGVESFLKKRSKVFPWFCDKDLSSIFLFNKTDYFIKMINVFSKTDDFIKKINLFSKTDDFIKKYKFIEYNT